MHLREGLYSYDDLTVDQKKKKERKEKFVFFSLKNYLKWIRFMIL